MFLMTFPSSKSFCPLWSSHWLLLVLFFIITIIVNITIIIYYHLRSSGKVVRKKVNFTFLYLHLQLKHEEGLSVNFRQRQMFLNSSLYPACSGWHLNYRPYKNHQLRSISSSLQGRAFLRIRLSIGILNKYVKANEERNSGYMQIYMLPPSHPTVTFLPLY